MCKVSLLIPVYNVSAFIERCAHSLFRQTFEDVEYVFVNDCTPDDSMERLEAVVKQYPERVAQVKVVTHEQNQGLAVARRTALLAASGEYVCCVDSDDYVEADMVECMYRKAIEEQADIVVADIWMEYPGRTEIFVNNVSPDAEENRVGMLYQEYVSPSLCNKMIRRRFWLDLNVFTPTGMSYCEDWYITTRLYFYARKIVKVDRAFYHYIHSNVHSITYKRTERHFKDILLFRSSLDDFLQKEGFADKYEDVVNRSKIGMKARLMVDTNSYQLKKKYAFMFRDIEMKYIGELRVGEKLVLCCLHYKLYPLAQLFQFLIRLKNGKL